MTRMRAEIPVVNFDHHSEDFKERRLEIYEGFVDSAL